MHVTAGAHTERGPRKTNQDAHCIDLDHGLFLVADGMGGHNAGDVASRLAVDAVVEFIQATSASKELTWPFAYDPARSRAANRLIVAFRLANRRVFEAASKIPEQAGMGTTIVAGLVDAGRLALGHVGDSRAYCLHADGLKQMTQDDTWINALVAAGAKAGAADHPMRHVLTRGIGMRSDIQPSVNEVALQNGNHWLFCTDGVHGHVGEGVIAAALVEPTPEAAAQRVVAAATAAGTLDNATALAIFVR
ncbi:MAG: PP2C family protein-serine/threonine phosphatase [Acidobacteriota bacterium]